MYECECVAQMPHATHAGIFFFFFLFCGGCEGPAQIWAIYKGWPTIYFAAIARLADN